ncbi:hypothetical protein ACOSP7_024617 [Xanthoceras sorbifolium]
MLSGLVSFDGVLKPDVTEAKAVLFGVSMALEGGFSSFSIESDAASVIKGLTSIILHASEFGVVLEDIRLLIRSFRAVVKFFFYVPHCANKVAHILARFSFDFDN